jgi:endo-1,4-beta-mannosidase
MIYQRSSFSLKALPSFLIGSRFFAILAGAAIGFSVINSAAEPSKMQLIVMRADGRGFAERDFGRPYIVFGTNYYDPHTGWAPKIWRQFDAEKVRRHFRIMSELGVNCARVFLTAGSFQPNAETVEEQALEKLDALIEIARETGIRLLLTGPDHWEGQPSYWKPDRFAGEAALQALEHFWDVVGRCYRGEPAIFAWDLLNEPHLPWFVEQWRPQWNDWLQKTYGSWESLKASWGGELTEEERWGEVAVAKNQPDSENPRLRDWQLFREHLADQWVRRQVEVIRRADPTHLITVGYIQWSYPLIRPGNPSRYSAFNPHRQAYWLDFVTIHFYPTLGNPFGSEENWGENLGYLQAVLAYCHTSKPVVLGEYGWYGGGAPQNHPYLNENEQASWLSAEIEASRPLADGWLSWPFADSPESTDISLFAGLVKADLTMKSWGRKFRTLAENLPELKRSVPEMPGFNFPNVLTADSEELGKMHRSYVEAIQQSIDVISPMENSRGLER